MTTRPGRARYVKLSGLADSAVIVSSVFGRRSLLLRSLLRHHGARRRRQNGRRRHRDGVALFQVRPHVATLAEAQPALAARIRLNSRVVVHVRL